MDFFEYASVSATFVNKLWVQLLVGGICFAIVFGFEAVALFIIARREGYKNKWMAFIPFLNTYYIGVCAQKNKFHNIDAKTIGLVTAVFEFLLFVFYVLYYVACYLVRNYEVATETTTTILGMNYTTTEYTLENVPDNLLWAAWMYNYMYRYILRFVDLLFLLCEVCLLITFFQTYACRRYVLFTITSILFPIQGILFFVVRNNKGLNYKEFVRGEQARIYRMYQQQQQQNFNQNPYNQNPYSRTPYDNAPNYGSGSAPEDPFGDLGGNSNTGGNSGNVDGNGNSENSGGSSGGSPFDEFDN